MSMDVPGFSQVPGSPSFRKAAVNNVVLVPLLTHKDSSKSALSFENLFHLLRRHAKIEDDNDLLYVIPNNSLTRPGDWRYNETPLQSFHWEHGCQRMQIYDGRPENSRYAHDRLLNNVITKDWIDLIPSRRTAAVIGVLNMHDCKDISDLHRAEEELHKWAERYATHPYEVTTATGKFTVDKPVERLFVFDSFDEDCQKIDLNQANMGNRLLAFPPYDETHSQMMDLHLNVVVNDLAVAIFLSLEEKIQQADAIVSATQAAKSGRRSLFTKTDEQQPQAKITGLSLSDMASLVRPGSKLATTENAEEKEQAEEDTNIDEVEEKAITNQQQPQLLTPLDESHDFNELSKKDIEGLQRRNRARWQKFAADLALLAGSPLDAYQRYLKAAGVSKSIAPDPLWYAFALIGCATAHIAMAECGGFNVDEYLENNFQLPEEIMNLVKKDPKEEKRPPQITGSKQTLPEIVFELSDEASTILIRNPKLAALQAELLLNLAHYTSESAKSHLQCRWGDGEGCYGGSEESPRWLQTSVSQLQFNDLKTRDGNDMILINQFNRMKRTCELLQDTCFLGGLDTSTRIDVALVSLDMCARGVKATSWRKKTAERISLPRKAAFFGTLVAEAISSLSGTDSDTKTDAWASVVKLYSPSKNTRELSGNYGWATLRATVLHALSIQEHSPICQEASQLLLGLLGQTDTVSSTSVFSQITETSNRSVGEKPVQSSVPEPKKQENIPLPSDDFTESEYDEETEIDESAGSETGGVKGRLESTTFASKLREGFASMTTIYPVIAQEARWAGDEAVAPNLGPLQNGSDLAGRVIALNCVWSSVEHRRCIAAQKACIERVLQLQRMISSFPSRGLALTNLSSRGNASLPIYVSSAKAIKSDPTMDLECVKKKIGTEDKGAMSTFYNPYESKRKAGADSLIRIAEDEEQALLIEFENTLSVPFVVSRCELVFDKDSTSRVQATALSFVIPPKARKYMVNFPFTILPRTGDSDSTDYLSEAFEVKGLALACLGRSITLPIEITKKKIQAETCEESKIPSTLAVYPRGPKGKSADEPPMRPRFESFPCQPMLDIFKMDKRAHVPPNEEFVVSLSDGVITSLHALYLTAYNGPSHRGKIERLQILSVGLAGQADKVLFDTGVNASSDPNLEDFIGTEDSASPLRLRCHANLKLDDINSSDAITKTRNEVKIEMASALNFSSKWPNGIALTIRIRYQGVSTSSVEVWRRREFRVKVKYTRGPFINRLAVSPALLQNSMFHKFSELMHLRHRFLGNEEKKEDNCSKDAPRFDVKSMPLPGRGPYICGERCGLLLTVRNTLPMDIIVNFANSGDAVDYRGLGSLRINKGSSGTLPVLLARFQRLDDMNLDRLAKSLAANFVYRWKADEGDMSGIVLLNEREVLESLQKDMPLLAHLCDSPCEIQLSCEKDGSPLTDLTVRPGDRFTFRAKLTCRDWVPSDYLSSNKVEIEVFCCKKEHAFDVASRGYVWSGKLSQNFALNDVNIEHTVSVIFTEAGQFSLSACARFLDDSRGQIWWANEAKMMNVAR